MVDIDLCDIIEEIFCSDDEDEEDKVDNKKWSKR